MKPLTLLFGLLVLSNLSYSQVDQQKGIFKFDAEPLYVYSETNRALVWSGSEKPNLFLVDMENDLVTYTYDFAYNQYCAVSKDGRYIFYTNHKEGITALYEAQTGSRIWQKNNTGKVERASFDFQNQKMAMVENQMLGMFNVSDGSSCGFKTLPLATNSVHCMPVEDHIVYYNDNKSGKGEPSSLVIYNTAKGKVVGNLVSEHVPQLIRVAKNGLVVGHSWKGVAYAWQATQDGKIIATRNTKPKKEIKCDDFRLSDSGNFLITFEKESDENHYFTVWKTNTWETVSLGGLNTYYAHGVFYANDTKFACNAKGKVILLNVQSGKVIRNIYGGTGTGTFPLSSQPVASTQAKKTEEPSYTQKPLPTPSTGNPLDEVQQYFQQRNMPKAIEKLTEIISIGEEYVDEAYYYRGVAHVYSKDYLKAIADLEMALQLRPDQAHIYNDLAWVNMLERRFDMALRVLREGLKVDDELFPLTLNLANAYYLNGMQDEAKETYKKVFLLMETDEQYQNAVLADLDLFISENFRSDATAWKKWVADYYNGGAKYYPISNRLQKEGRALKQENKWTDAALKYIQAAEAEEKTPSPRQSKISLCYWGAGSCYFDLNQFDKVVPLYEKTLAIERKLAKGEALAYRLEFLYHTHTELKNIEKANAYKKEWDVEIARLKGIIAQNNNVRTACEDAYLAKDPVKGLKIANEWYEKIKDTANDQMIASVISNRIIFNDMLGDIGAVVQDYEMIRKIIKKESIDDDVVLMALPLVGNAYKKMGDKVNAMMVFFQTTEIAQEMGSLNYESMSYSLLGDLFVHNYQFEKGLEQYNRVLGISESNKIHMLTYKTYTQIGTLYSKWGKYDKALEFYNKSLDMNRKIESGEYKYISESFKGQEQALYDANLLTANKLDEIFTTIKKGDVYLLWGKNWDARQQYNSAHDKAKKIGHQKSISHALNSLGYLELLENKVELAIQMYSQAKDIAEKENDSDGIVTMTNNLALAYSEMGKTELALSQYEEVLMYWRKGNDRLGIATGLRNAGNIYSDLKNSSKAMQYYSEALSIYRELKMRPDIASTLKDLSITFIHQERYDEAIKNLTEAVSILENIRLTATGSIKRDYVAKQIQAYGTLIDALMLKGNMEEALAAFENSKTRLLTEMLSEGGMPHKKLTIKEVQAILQPDQVVILFANVNYRLWKSISAIVITKNNAVGKRIPLEKLVSSIDQDYKHDMIEIFENQRGFKVVKKQDEQVDLRTKDQFAEIVNYYRSTLKKPNASDQEVSKRIYKHILEPLESLIAGSKKLLIVPDGVLGFLPFETLIDGDGKYMAEKYNISYALSLTVQRMVSARSYPDGRKPMLAFGGAIYESTFTDDQFETDAQVVGMRKDLYGRPGGKRSLRDFYARIGIGNWENLPGTLSEVKQIEALMKGAELVTDRRVSETYVKELSTQGKLKEYKVLHFATHGVVVPEVPDLSALVLTQEKVDIMDDGYLRTEEIADLNIQADFVNLSACETGLGKIYGGEGIVGLTQSFLLAGANSLSVSLWQVNDISTQKFMVDVYREVVTNKISFAEAIGKVKLKFIRGEFGSEYKLPYYWAPFVFYGVDK
jgi:CHAT domain-containing protein/Tfp pilus assembly protein PilF